MIETEFYKAEKRDGYHVAIQVLLGRLEHATAHENSGFAAGDEAKASAYQDLIAAVRRLHAGDSDIQSELSRIAENPEKTKQLLAALDDESYKTDGRLYAYKAVALLADATETAVENLLVVMRADLQEAAIAQEKQPVSARLGKDIEEGLRRVFLDMAAKIRHDIGICVEVHHSLQDYGAPYQQNVATVLAAGASTRPVRH